MMRKTSYVLFATMLLIGIVAVPAIAQDSTAVGQDRATSRVLLQHDDFVRLNVENVGDALSTITGVYVNAEGEVMLRDVSASKVVVVMDGQKLNVASGSGVNVSNISIDNVESVELLRGGRSAEFGADAVGGVIVIKSKAKTENAEGTSFSQNFGARATTGSYNLQIFSLNHSLQTDKLSTLLSYRRDIWSGNFDYTDIYGNVKELPNNNLNSNSIFGKVGYQIDEEQTFATSYSYYKSENGSAGTITNLTPLSRLRYDNQSANMNYSNNDLFSGFRLDANTFYQNYRTRFDNPQGTVPVHSDHKNYATGIELKQAGALTSMLNLSYGYSYRNDEINSTDVGDRNRITHSAFTTITVANTDDILTNLSAGLVSGWDVALATRYDSPSDFRSEFSPRLSLGLTNANNFATTRLQSHIAKSYRAPSFNDLYWPKDSFAMGNPDLVPETSINYDIGINISVPIYTHSVSTAVNYFRNDAEDLILWAPNGPNGLWIPENISETETWGMETSGSITLFDGLFTTNAEFTYMEALDKRPEYYNNYIIYRPKNKLSLTGTLKTHGIEWSVVYNYTGLRYTKASNGNNYLPSYTTINSNISYNFNLQGVRQTIAFELTNIADEDYMKTDGTAEPGRMYKLSYWINL